MNDGTVVVVGSVSLTELTFVCVQFPIVCAARQVVFIWIHVYKAPLRYSDEQTFGELRFGDERVLADSENWVYLTNFPRTSRQQWRYMIAEHVYLKTTR